DQPAATITLVLKTKDSQPRETILKIGGTAPDGRFVQVNGNDTIAVLSDSKSEPLASRLLAEHLKFRDRTLIRFADADRIVMERGPRKVTFAKVDGTWRMTAPLSAEAEATALDELLNAVARLRPDELITEKPADLKPFGLDAPEIRWQFF